MTLLKTEKLKYIWALVIATTSTKFLFNRLQIKTQSLKKQQKKQTLTVESKKV